MLYSSMLLGRASRLVDQTPLQCHLIDYLQYYSLIKFKIFSDDIRYV